MEQPKKEKKKITVKNAGNGNLNGMMEKENELLLNKQELERNAKVTKQSTTPEFAKNMKETQGVIMNKEGKATPKIQNRNIQIAKPGSGQKTRVIGEDRSVIAEADPGTAQEKEMIRKVKAQEADTNRRRSNAADVVNYQTGDGKGNRVYDEKLNQQKNRKVIIRK